ncbi:hypothetical protein CDN99_21860 [Roseateles aquatilis]|uniref:Uncharacterized protein n=2 Tax=Roseateles aquatilis TaxID=431061 RepID=A0A246IZH8_9BURK|nr:hypothetical protein CDN99_21860 [Roseateles aquatilis]
MQAGVVGLTLALLGATAIAADPPAPPKPPPRPTGIAPKGDFTAGLARPEGDPGATGHDELSDDAFRAKAEAAAIRKSGVAAKRNGTRLILSSSGRPIVFDSVWPGIGGANESAFEDYRFDGLSPDREFYIVRATYYEGTNVLWVSRKDGTRHEMHGEARPSPDGSFIAMANASEAHDFNGILVWERAQGRLIERFRLVPSPDQPAFYRFMRWKDGRTVELEKTTRGDPITCPHANEETLVVLVRDGERWTLKDVSPPRCAR